jgi:outer membrane protein assembly factor BamA
LQGTSKFNFSSDWPDTFAANNLFMPKTMFTMALASALAITVSAQETDSLSFIRSKKMNDADLAKKREGTFITGLPDFSSDPVTGFGFGVKSNIYWNGKRDNPLFAYTPYLARVKANVAYYTSNARELTISADMPYFRGSRWRFRVDFKAQQNPSNLYFGSSENTLGQLSLPSDPTKTFATYKEYDNARKTLRPGGPGEASMVSDALSNRFRETEFMLNLKADYAVGKGKWRIMGGYELQNLQYKTFHGAETEATHPSTGQNSTVPNGISLLERDYEQGLIFGLDGGWVSLIQTALIYDTRDFEPDPTKGIYFEAANEFSNKIIGSQFNFNKLFFQGRMYKKLPVGKRTVLAGRIGVGTIFGDKAPFFEFQDQWSPDGSINALGGKQSLRGYRSNRFLARSLAFANVELRARIADLKLGKQNFGFGLAPFFDAGTVRDKWQYLNFSKIKISYGAGARIAWNLSTILFFDYGISKEDKLFYFGIGQVF